MNYDDDYFLFDLFIFPNQYAMSESPSPPRILIIGAGSRGSTYARWISSNADNPGVVYAVAEPTPAKRRSLGAKWIWGPHGTPGQGQEFGTWQDFVNYEKHRRAREAAARQSAEQHPGRQDQVEPGVDAVFICVLDGMHRDVILGLASIEGRPLNIMCEKPLATTLEACIDIWNALSPCQARESDDGASNPPEQDVQRAIISIGHVLRYSPHNMLLRKLVLQERVIGAIMSINHTEPVGWWHFTHSYVR